MACVFMYDGFVYICVCVIRVFHNGCVLVSEVILVTLVHSAAGD